MSNKEQEVDLLELAQTIWSKKKEYTKWIVYSVVAGLIIGFSNPREYTSSVILAPERDSNSGGLSASAGALASMVGIGGLTASENGINESIYPEIIKSSPFVLEFADMTVNVEKKDGEFEKMAFSDYILDGQKLAWWNYIPMAPRFLIGLFVNEPDTATIKNSPKIQSEFNKKINERISVEIDSKTNIITLTSTFQDKEIARIIADSVYVKLQRYMGNYKTAKTRDNLKSNSTMLSDAQQHYYAKDEEYARAADRNQNLISQSAKIKLERLENEKNLAYDIYSQLASQVAADKIQLQANVPIATIIEPATKPIRPSSMGKAMTLVLTIILAILTKTMTIIVKELYKQQEEA